MVKRLLGRLVDTPLARSTTGFYRVETTTVRIRVRQVKYYSGYKHHRGLKPQVLADEQREIHHLSTAYPARVHDKVIEGRNVAQVQTVLDRPVLGEKAYAGAKLEGKGLIRPLRHNEGAYKTQPEQAKAFNRALSRRRVRIEHIMANLKQFRILGGKFGLALEWYPLAMKAVALVHNLQQATA